MGLFLSVVPVGVDNERAEELGDYEPARSHKKNNSITGQEWHARCASGAPSHELIFYKRERGVEMETVSVQEGMCRVCDLCARSGYVMCEILP